MPPLTYNDTENKRADEQVKEAAIASIPGGGSDAGGKDNKRADFGVNEKDRGRVVTTGSDHNPGPVMEFDEMGGA